jgi:hypothetical protein
VDWSDVLKAALAVFLVVSAVGLGYLLYRMAGLFLSLARSVDRLTDETVPILSRAQITMDGVNQEIGRVDEIMESAVHGTKGLESAVTSLAHGISAPVRWGAGVVAGVEEAVDTFRSRRAAERANRRSARSEPPPPPPRPGAAPSSAGPPPPAAEPPSGVRTTSQAAAPGSANGWAEQKARRAEAAARSADAARRKAGG